jgi:phosphoribosyl-AMP cyclohydrolase
MTKTQQERELKDAGFAFYRNGKRHQLWKKGETIVAISHGNKISPNTERSFRMLMRRHREQAVA